MADSGTNCPNWHSEMRSSSVVAVVVLLLDSRLWTVIVASNKAAAPAWNDGDNPIRLPVVVPPMVAIKNDRRDGRLSSEEEQHHC